MDGHPSRIEAERLIGVSEKLLFNRDLNGSREFALLAQETDPLLDGSDQILAIIDVLLASERRVNNHHDWYSILQIDRRTDDQDLIKRQYRRLALLLHPDKNKFPFADHAFRFVAASWAVLSDPGKKSIFDRELSFFTTVDLTAALAQQVKPPVVRRPGASGGLAEVGREQPLTDYRPPPPPPPEKPEEVPEQNGDESRSATFWSTCPYCYVLHEYPSMYEDCCLKCQECERAFHGVAISSLPPLVPGKDAYRFCWGAFQLGFRVEKTVKPPPPPPPPPPAASAAKIANAGAAAEPKAANAGSGTRGNRGVASTPGTNGPKKRGRPRKYAP